MGVRGKLGWRRSPVAAHVAMTRVLFEVMSADALYLVVSRGGDRWTCVREVVHASHTSQDGPRHIVCEKRQKKTRDGRRMNMVTHTANYTRCLLVIGSHSTNT